MSHHAVQSVVPCLSVRACTLLAVVAVLAATSAAGEAKPPATADDPQYLVTFWSTEDGLPSNTISDLVQTRDGYLWASTYDGLVRFDGVRFVRAGPPESMDRQASRILCLHLDQRGQLWLGTDGAGLLRYDGERFHTFLPAEPASSLNVVRALAEDAAGNLWLGTRGGLGRWRDGKVTWFTPAEFANAANSVWNLTFDRDERLWITDWVSLKSFRNGNFESALMRPEARVPLRAVYSGQSGDLWVGMLGQALRRTPAGDWKPVGEVRDFGNSEVTAFCETSSGELWLGARKGLYQWRNGSWVPFKRDRLEVTEVRVLFEDREGNLWVGTGTAGLVRLKRPSVRTFAAADGLSDGPVLAVRPERDGGLWVGLPDGGIAEQKGDGFVPWQPGQPAASGTKSIDAPVKSILRTRDGAVWVGTFGNGLTRFQDGQSLRFVPSIGTFARVDKITSLLEDHKGGVWVGTFYSLYRLSESNLLVQVPVGGREVLAQVMAVLESRAGLWVAFDGVGLARISGNQALWLTRREGLPTHFVRTLHEDTDGNLWIGTTAGLCCWRDGVVETWTTAQGLISDTILQILEDDDGNLWLGSKAGIMRVAKTDLKAVADGRKALLDVFAFGRGEGMASVECSGGFYPSAAKTSDGRFWFPTAKGLVMVDTSRLTRASNPSPPVHIEEVRADGKVVARPHISPALPANTGRAATTVLPYDTRRLEFAYTAPGLTTPERVRFRHRLKDFDSDWTDAGTVRSAVYTKLAPGEYRFEVIACNNDGIWSEAGHPHAFRILAPFWKTGWFLGLAGLVTAGSIGTMVRFVSVRHLRRKLWRLEQAHAIEKERMRIAQDMHDEIGGKLSRISFLSDMASRGLPEKSEASQQIEQVSEAAREVIRTVDEIVWAVSPRNDTLDSAIHYICRHAEEFFELTPIELELELPDEVPVLRLSTEVRHNLFCAVKEALNNALKHAQATNVRIAFTAGRVVPGVPHSFQITITDNGRGFCAKELFGAGAEAVPTSVVAGDGLLNMRERLQSIGGTCTVESQTGNGARVTFTIPLPP
jgi:ligand-binding sensor domain-containing protein/signal transduction histidine kinase